MFSFFPDVFPPNKSAIKSNLNYMYFGSLTKITKVLSWAGEGPDLGEITIRSWSQNMNQKGRRTNTAT